ncbi:MAG: Gfo/Idh/MocA family oxidoreductase [Verrucomicrobiales bacterium]|nr:Gfo/Idh/MocA family oxidoreductase [Verrucomicrobiales bacterium]
MADEQWLKSNIVFGSAGMAASGMLPQPPAKPKPKPKPKPEPVALEIESPFTVDEEIEEQVFEEEIVEVEPIQPVGYGINSKAQGLFSDLKVGIIGCGSRVVDGCDWDYVFRGIPGLIVEGISDPIEDSMSEMQEVYSFEGGYSDYRELLARSKPNLVAIPQTSTAKRYEIIKNCLMSGAHVVCPAPFTRSLEEADELIALADRRGLKLAVSHPMRLDPNIERFYDLREELIGDLVEIRVFGEMDEKAGGEDLLVRGAPLFDLVRMFAGDSVWASATVLNEGERSTREDIVDDPESPWGPLVGDVVSAQFYTENDVMVSFISNRKLSDVHMVHGMEFVGTKSVMRLFGGDQPTLSLMQNPGDQRPDGDEKWVQWPEHRNPYHPVVDELEGAEAANRLTVADWLEGISQDREAVNSGKQAMKALEMVHAVFQSALSGRRVYFPLANRHHPLTPEVKPYEVEYKETA